jgi:hypothetical protein
MLAYNKQSLDNLLIQQESEVALRRKLISKEECTAIAAAHPVNLYTPNIFIRVGLFLATAICALAGFGILTMMFPLSGAMNVILLFYSAFLYAALEWMVHYNKQFHSGVDDALLWFSLGFIFGTVNYFASNISPLQESILVFVLSLFAVLRFANWAMSAVMILSFFAVIFYALTPLGAFAKIILPFLLMAVSLIIYLINKRNKTVNALRHYSSCLLTIEVISLIGIYGSVNYFVVRELSNTMFDLHLPPGASITGGWFFWIATLVIPPVYLFLSLRNKDAVLLRVGLLLLAATIVTIRFYYAVVPVEMAMTIGGAVLMALMYIINRYLKTPKHGITSSQNDDPDVDDLSQLEGMVIAETFHRAPAAPSEDGFRFGGGSGGGGGATGQY